MPLGTSRCIRWVHPSATVVAANEFCNLFVHSLILRFAWTLEGMPFSDWWARRRE